MSNEREWVEAVADRIRIEGQLEELDGVSVRVGAGARLPYLRQVLDPKEKGSFHRNEEERRADLLLYDQLDIRRWVPRVVIECALGGVTSNDALTLSAKAARHKHIHPYLRCGVLIGGRNLFSTPAFRIFRHGDRFDFIASWSDEVASEAEWALFAEILREEVQHSRAIQDIFSANRDPAKYSVVHRQLIFK
jgi:hypothetical protein